MHDEYQHLRESADEQAARDATPDYTPNSPTLPTAVELVHMMIERDRA